MAEPRACSVQAARIALHGVGHVTGGLQPKEVKCNAAPWVSSSLTDANSAQAHGAGDEEGEADEEHCCAGDAEGVPQEDPAHAERRVVVIGGCRKVRGCESGRFGARSVEIELVSRPEIHAPDARDYLRQAQAKSGEIRRNQARRKARVRAQDVGGCGGHK